VFCENGNYFPDPLAGMMTPTTAHLQSDKNSGAVINRVYFAPTSDACIIINGAGGTPELFQGPYPGGTFPPDLWAAVQQVASGPGFGSLSWIGNGIWAVLGKDNSYVLGDAVPAALTAKLNSYQTANQRVVAAAGGGNPASELYEPYCIAFAPSGEWLLCGSVGADQGTGTYDASANFPADVLAAAAALPNRVSLSALEFDPSGGWIMIDTTNAVHYGGTVEPALQTQLAAVGPSSGQVILDVACLTPNIPVLPMGPVQQPPGASSNFDVVAGAHGGAMQTTITLDSGGNIFGTTIMSTSNKLFGCHCMVVLVFYDYTGQPIPACTVANRFGVDAAASATPMAWGPGWTIGTGYLQLIRSVAIVHVNSPNSLQYDFGQWMQDVGLFSSAVGQLLQPIASAFGAGGKGTAGSGTAGAKTSG
jgi:hypothetical protein